MSLSAFSMSGMISGRIVSSGTVTTAAPGTKMLMPVRSGPSTLAIASTTFSATAAAPAMVEVPEVVIVLLATPSGAAFGSVILVLLLGYGWCGDKLPATKAFAIDAGCGSRSQ